LSIVNSVKTLFPGFGNATEYIALTGQSVVINATTTFTLTGFINYVRSGRIRLQTSAAPASSQITGITITATDGTTTVYLYQDAIARTAATLFSLLIDFISDLNITSISVLVTAANAGTAQTLDLEVAGNP
jgi:hypothetical protein